MVNWQLGSILLSVALANAGPPACTPDYGKVNTTIRDSALNVRGQYGQTGQSTGMYSIHVGQYMGFPSVVANNFPALSDAIADLTTNLRQAEVKCNTCAEPDGALMYRHPYKTPVVSYQDLEGIFTVGSNVIGDVLYKYCANDVNTAVCKDSPSYCSDAPPGQEKPSNDIKGYIRNYIKDNLAAFGTGPASSKGGLPPLQKGAVYPYYKCLATYGSANATKTFEDEWFGFMRNLLALNGTGCV